MTAPPPPPSLTVHVANRGLPSRQGIIPRRARAISRSPGHCSKWSQPSENHCPILPSSSVRFCKVTITGAAASREVIFSHREIHTPLVSSDSTTTFLPSVCCVLLLLLLLLAAVHTQCHRVSALTKGEGGGWGRHGRWGLFHFREAMPPRGELKGRCPREGARQTGCHSWQCRRRIPLHTARGGGGALMLALSPFLHCCIVNRSVGAQRSDAHQSTPLVLPEKGSFDDASSSTTRTVYSVAHRRRAPSLVYTVLCRLRRQAHRRRHYLTTSMRLCLLSSSDRARNSAPATVAIAQKVFPSARQGV